MMEPTLIAVALCLVGAAIALLAIGFRRGKELPADPTVYRDPMELHDPIDDEGQQ